ncbi:hypothetical protein HMPREF9151_01884 [Hoylesella saccharolytica F0055]|uniref:Uncharacterized protein n=1 Tax=Hoylesella saccharolytica F0055 TaxID=1127699 RepID=L1N665_9BACT|nr:hypothetical protein HMPREF9151_01884 [Hoylesella saccharolytica F0055]
MGYIIGFLSGLPAVELSFFFLLPRLMQVFVKLSPAARGR